MSRVADAEGNDVILCVDDDVVLVRLVQRLFSRRGHVVEHAADTATGLARVKRGGVAAVTPTFRNEDNVIFAVPDYRRRSSMSLPHPSFPLPSRR